MARFIGIAPGEERIMPGLRIKVPADGETVYMSGKWLDLGPDHMVAVISEGGRAEFVRSDGTVKAEGSFPAWVVRGTGKHPARALLFNAGQFVGGVVRIFDRRGERTELPIAA